MCFHKCICMNHNCASFHLTLIISRALFPNISTLGIRASTYKLGRHYSLNKRGSLKIPGRISSKYPLGLRQRIISIHLPSVNTCEHRVRTIHKSKLTVLQYFQAALINYKPFLVLQNSCAFNFIHWWSSSTVLGLS